jgi:signal transduction histidine kinase
MREAVGRRKNGGSFPLEWAVSKVCLSERPIYTVIFRDISDRRMLETQLRHAQKLESIGQLAAGIAHEINTPTQYISDNTRFLDDAFRDLSTLVAQCGELRRAAAGSGDVAAAVAAVADATAQADTEYLLEEIPRAIRQSLEGLEHVAKIVRSMKEFSHPGGEEMQAVDLNRSIDSTLTVSRNEWKYVADVVTEFDPQLPMIHCLPGEVNQVILNLIVNAAHAIADKVRGGTVERGTITVSTRRDGDWVQIAVADTGTGIPLAIQGRVFDPFFTTKEVGRGTGQGLAIAHSVVTDKHGGTIRFESRPGEGTTFFVRLPIHPPKPRTRVA